MIKINRRSSFLRPLLFAALPFGLLSTGAMSAHAGSVSVTGTNGANGRCLSRGGPGGVATATTTTPGDPSNTATAQGGRGGAGGNACSGLGNYGSGGGPGGAATATATTKIATGSASAAAIGTGGAGGAGGRNWYGVIPPSIPDGAGGGATAISSAADAGAGAVTSSATAYGGNGGETGGTASAVASGQSTGSGSVDAAATAYGGSGDVGGAATASATGLALTGKVQTNASATGGTAGSAASAASLAQNSSGKVRTTASSPGGGVGTEARVGAVSLDPADIGAGRAVSNAILTPTGSDVGVGAMSAAYGGSGSPVTYEATATFDFSKSFEALDLKLSDNFVENAAGVAFDSMELLVIDGTAQIKKTFSTLAGSAGAETYFTADPIIGLGKVAAGQSIEIEYFLGYNSGTSAGVGDGFGFTYDLVDPPPSAAVPEPSTWALMALGFAGLGFVGYRKAQKNAAVAA